MLNIKLLKGIPPDNGEANHTICQWHSELWLMVLKDSNACLVGYSDANWTRSVDDQKSTSAGYFYLRNNLVSWMSKKQNFVSLSTTEVEYSCWKLLHTTSLDEEVTS